MPHGPGMPPMMPGMPPGECCLCEMAVPGRESRPAESSPHVLPLFSPRLRGFTPEPRGMHVRLGPAVAFVQDRGAALWLPSTP